MLFTSTICLILMHFAERLQKFTPFSGGPPYVVAALITFLASLDAAFITGEIYRIDGGRMSKLSLT